MCMSVRAICRRTLPYTRFCVIDLHVLSVCGVFSSSCHSSRLCVISSPGRTLQRVFLLVLRPAVATKRRIGKMTPPPHPRRPTTSTQVEDMPVINTSFDGINAETYRPYSHRTQTIQGAERQVQQVHHPKRPGSLLPGRQGQRRAEEQDT